MRDSQQRQNRKIPEQFRRICLQPLFYAFFWPFATAFSSEIQWIQFGNSMDPCCEAYFPACPKRWRWRPTTAEAKPHFLASGVAWLGLGRSPSGLGWRQGALRRQLPPRPCRTSIQTGPTRPPRRRQAAAATGAARAAAGLPQPAAALRRPASRPPRRSPRRRAASGGRGRRHHRRPG